MLLGTEDEDRISDVIVAVAAALGIYLLGRDVLTRRVSQNIAVSTGNMQVDVASVLDDVFLAGKVTQVLGESAVKTMTAVELRQWAAQNVVLTQEEVAVLNSLKETTARWIQGRSAAWQQEFRKALAQRDQEFRNALVTGNPVDAEERAIVKEAVKADLVEGVKEIKKTIEADVDKLVQTEMAAYFQQGQVMQMPLDTYVYKVPRQGACQDCLRLHLNVDGSPKIYRLSEILGNSNYGHPHYMWGFVIGPTHPHCYCVLRSVDKAPAGGPNEAFATLRHRALNSKREAV